MADVDARRHKKTGIPSHPYGQRQSTEPPRKSPLYPSAHKPDLRDQQPKNRPHARRPETDPSQPVKSPLHHESTPRGHTNPPRQQHRQQAGSGSSLRSPNRATPGAPTPMQPTNPSKHKHGPAGQTPERRASTERHAPHTPGRSRRNQGGRGHEALEEDVVVPPFGEWEKDSDAASGEKYTDIFNRVRDDKLSPTSSVRQSPSATRTQGHKVQQTCPCCIL